jgi:hypothetical protein
MCEYDADLSDNMADSYSISKRTWKWMRKHFSYVLDLTILNSYIVYKSCEGSMTHRKFVEQLVRDLPVLSYREDIEVRGVPRGQPRSSENQMS